ncbi:MAG: hypothetical protein K9M99_06170 [Candidatus Cloacimonetes bacterium]|nr:hypothetical protein [Candidatus Cloacimonadota bacterium]
MKYLLIIVLLAGSALLLAHPASKMDLSFDKETSVLTVNFEHQVKDVEKHFIFEILVYLNGDQIIEQKLEKQDNLETGEVFYKIVDAKPGDKIKVRTNCNKTGKKSAELVIE